MPQGLPTSDSLPIHPPHKVIHAVASAASASSSPTSVVFSKETAVSLCETLISSANVSGSHMFADHSAPSSINVVVSSDSKPVSVAKISTDTNTVMSSQYHLTELVQQEKDLLFSVTATPDVMLEPAQDGVPVVRRNRHFFTLMEEENSDDESKIPRFGEKMKEPALHTHPAFNFGDNLKRFYLQQKRQKKQGLGEHLRELERPLSAPSEGSSGYESDPEGKYGLSQLILPGLRRNQSHPELSAFEQAPAAFSDDYQLTKSRSLPTTPRVSPKLRRRNSLTKHDQPHGEIQKSGPGFSFLAHVAGELHRNKIKHEQTLQNVARVTEKLGLTHTVHTAPTKVTSTLTQPVVSAVTTENAHAQVTSLDHHGSHFTDFASDEIHSHSHTPQFVQKIIDWSTKKKVKVNAKETNVWSPTSF